MKRWLLAIGLLCALNAHAAEVTATVSANPVGVEDRFQLTLEVKDFSGDVQFPRISGLEGLRILGGPSRNTSYQMINNQFSREISHSYVVQAEKTGTVTIPAFTVRVGDEEFKTKPIRLEVKSGSIAPQQSSRQRTLFDLWDDPFNQPRRRPRTISKDSVFIRTEMDRNQAYVGEGLVVSYRLFTAVPVGNLSMKDVPDFSGFLTEDLVHKQPVDRKTMVENGQRYDTAIIFRKILYPTRPGGLTLPEITFTMQVGDRLSMFGGSPLERKSQSRIINVLPLPEPQPPGFSGAVGDFSLRASVESDSVRTGESLSVNVIVTGRGDFNNVPLVFPDQVDGFKLFRPSAPDLKRDPEDPLKGTKQWNIVLVPQRTGDLKIPELTLNYFDPELREYRSRTTRPVTIRVERGEAVSVPVTGSGGQEIVQVGQDISYIQSGDRMGRSRNLVSTTWYRAGAVGGTLVLLLMGGILRWTDPSRKDPVRYRRSRAYPRFKRQIANAVRLRRKGKNRECCQTISKACIGYFADRWNRSVLDLKIDEIAHELEEQGVADQLVRGLVDLVEYCDFESYTPSGTSINPDILKDAEQVIARMEKQS